MPPFGMATKRKAEEMDETADGASNPNARLKELQSEWVKLFSEYVDEWGLDEAIDALIKAVAYG